MRKKKLGKDFVVAEFISAAPCVALFGKRDRFDRIAWHVAVDDDSPYEMSDEVAERIATRIGMYVLGYRPVTVTNGA